jgi:uncharacterized membrane protein (UPF0127 family)
MIEVLRDQERLCQAKLANSFFSRLRGLMLRKHLPKDEGLLIEFSEHLSSKGIHGFFMLFPLDLVFIGKDKRVVGVANLKPWRLHNPKEDCRWVLEVNEGFTEEKRIEKGDRLSFQAD